MREIPLKAEHIFSIGSFHVTNSLLLSLVAALVLIGAAFVIKRRLQFIPSTIQSIFEILLEQFLSLMDQVLVERKKSEKYLPLIATIFLFILLSNWLGLLPGVGSFVVYHGAERAPLFRSPASDLNFTLALALISVITVNVLGVAAVGFWKHGKKYFNFSNPILFFVGILELISEFAKIASFSFRLFGNVFAGEVLLISIGLLIPYVLPLPFIMMELLVGIIQAFVFSMLTLVFVAMAVVEEPH